MSEGNSQSQTSISRSRSVSQAGGVFEDDWDRTGDRDMRQDTPSQEDHEDEGELDDGEPIQELEEEEEDLVISTHPKYEPCPEDEDFLAALDKMVNENIAESKNVGKERD